MKGTVKWELWRRHRRDGKPDEKLDSGESVSMPQAYRAIRLAEMNYPIGWCPELNFVIIDELDQRHEEGRTPSPPASEGVRNST